MLKEITKDNLTDVLKLKVGEGQDGFVADNSVSIAQAHYSDYAWFRAIYADDIPVGFIMLSDNPEEGDYFLWRLMVDGKYQGQGYGKKAVELLVDYVKTRPNANELLVSYGEGEAGPAKFYEKLGFVPNGEKYGDEVGASLKLD